MCLTSCKEFRVRNFVYLTSLRSVYSLEEAFLHLLSYSPIGLPYTEFFTAPQGLLNSLYFR